MENTIIFFKYFFNKKKYRKLNTVKLLEYLEERYLNDNILKINCPRCRTNLGNFSHNFLKTYKEIYCPECDEKIWITVNLDFINPTNLFSSKEFFITKLSDDEIYKLYKKQIETQKIEEIKDKEI